LVNFLVKRIAWILLAVFCPAMVRVQPVDLAQCKVCVSCHCKIPGDCGMPCSRPDAPAPIMFAAEQSAKVTLEAGRRNLPDARLAEGKFYATVVEAATVPVALIKPVLMAPAAEVPLFKAHCSFLI
jgi:hypothetical protein